MSTLRNRPYPMGHRGRRGHLLAAGHGPAPSSCRALVLAFLIPLAFAVPAAESGIRVDPIRNPFAADDWKLPTNLPALSPGTGASSVAANCGLCHSLDYIATQPALTRAQWTAGVEKMRVRFGAPVPTNQVSELVEYLTTNYGKR